MLDIMESSKQGDAVGATSIGARAAILDGNPATGRLADVMSVHGLPRLYDRTFLAPTEIKVLPAQGEVKGIPKIVEIVKQDLREYLAEIHSETDEVSGVFGDAFSQTFVDVWNSEFCSCVYFVL